MNYPYDYYSTVQASASVHPYDGLPLSSPEFLDHARNFDLGWDSIAFPMVKVKGS